MVLNVEHITDDRHDDHNIDVAANHSFTLDFGNMMGSTQSTVDESFDFVENLFQLEQLLGQRSPRSALEDRNIIKENIAPSLQATSDAIRKKKTQEALEHRLEKRRSREDLLLAHILPEEMKDPSMAAGLQPAQQQLKFHRTQVELSHKLDNRRNRSELIESNIIKGDFAPTIQAARQSLTFQTRSIALDHKLEHRPHVSELVEHNILHTSEVAPNLQATQHQLKIQVRATSLDHKLEHRPRPMMLVEQHILRDAEDVITPTEMIDPYGARVVLVNTLEKKLEVRPRVELLVDNGIITA